METKETKWRRGRLKLYEKLEQSTKNGLNCDVVLAPRELFDLDASGRAVPKEFTFTHEDDAVTVVCAEIPQAAVRQWGGITQELLEVLGAGDEAKDVYVSDLDIMHVTLFYTSHPGDLAPRDANEHKSERLTREISLLRELATQFEPIRMTPVKLVLAASGAILMLYQCVRGEDQRATCQDEQKTKNAGSHAEFSVDLLRHAAKETFAFVSKKSPTAIIHTTLARLLSPEAFDESELAQVREMSQRISLQLANAEHANDFVVNKLWYVDESHYIRPTGHTTTISLGPYR